MNTITLTCRSDARRMMKGNGPTVSGLYRISGLDWLLAEREQLSFATTLRFVDLFGLPQDSTMGPLNTRSRTDFRRWDRDDTTSPKRQDRGREQTQQQTPLDVLKLSKPTCQTAWLRDYYLAISMEEDDMKYKGLDTPKGDSMFSAYDPVDIKNAKYLILANSD